ncbi:MAG: ABC transporter ATP-binding protein [Anaerolineaceae bacterium]|nr:ABC transporter ATP-binding protein [Anaerolineaceae bacterium]
MLEQSRTLLNINAAAGEQAQLAKPLVQLHNVIKKYQTASGDFIALNGIEAQFDRAEFVGIIGKSGAGKSTLVNMITGVDQLTSGEVWFEDIAVHKLNEDQKSLWRGRNVGVVYQTFQLIPSISLLDNILLPMEFCGLYQPRKSEERARMLLEEVELQDHAFKKPSAISGGQQQRAAIARALANDPQLIVADEPTGNLDSATAEIIFKIFEKLIERGKTVVIVSHDRSLEDHVSRILSIEDGCLFEDRQVN